MMSLIDSKRIKILDSNLYMDLLKNFSVDEVLSNLTFRIMKGVLPHLAWLLPMMSLIYSTSTKVSIFLKFLRQQDITEDNFQDNSNSTTIFSIAITL